MRLSGDIIGSDLIDKHDRSLRDSLANIVGGEIDDNAWHQATLGVRTGGLSLREAQTIALPAFLASRIASRPHVNEMAGHMGFCRGDAQQLIMEAYDKRTETALTRPTTRPRGWQKTHRPPHRDE